MERISLNDALAAGWQPVPWPRRSAIEAPPDKAVALYGRAGKLAWLLETPRGFELDVADARPRLQQVAS